MRSVAALGCLLLVAGCSRLRGGADAASPCVGLLTPEEVTQLGAPPPPMKHTVAGDICSYEAERGMRAAAYQATFGSTSGDMTRADVKPDGMWGRNARSVKSLAEPCGFEAWAVDLPDARLLVFAHGAAGGDVGFPKKQVDEAALVKACRLIGPRLPALAAMKIAGAK